MLWNRETDEFRLGQWFKGRIYERRADLSPDGKYLIYFAMNGRWGSEARGSWTAISRAPYLKAIALYPKGDCWLGGGLFTGNRTYYLNDGCGAEAMIATDEVTRDTGFHPSGGRGGECLSVYYPRLLRDGWQYVETINPGSYVARDIFEKPAGGGWVLRKIAHAELGAPPGKGCYWDEHELRHPDLPEPVLCPDWEWAEMDRGRLVWAARGCLRAGLLAEDGLQGETVLHDFNGMAFEAIAAPY